MPGIALVRYLVVVAMGAAEYLRQRLQGGRRRLSHPEPE